MKKKIPLLFLVGLLSVLFLLGSTLSVAAQEGEKYGGTLTISARQSLTTLNPLMGKGIYGYYATNSIFDPLITIDPDGLKPAPYVAKSWEVSEDATEFTFHIREGIEFHNGEKLTAEDVKFSLDWVLDPDNGSPMKSQFSWVKEVQQVDEYTVKIIANKSFPPGLSQSVARIVPKDTFQEMGEEEFAQNPVGSGPFKLKEWVKGDHATLVRNEDYWLKKPHLEEVRIRIIPEISTAELELEKGGVDITDIISPQSIPRFEKMEDVKVVSEPGLNTQFIGFNDKREPFNNVKFRKAVRMSLDMEGIVQVIFRGKGATPAYGVVPPSLWANDREWLKENATLEEDNEKAKEMFQELKDEGVIPDNFSFKIYAPPDPRREQLATIVATNLKQNGIEAQASPMEFGSLLDVLFAGKANMYIIGWVGVATSLDPYEFVNFNYYSSGSACSGDGYNLSCYENEEVDELIDKANTLVDREEREEAYVEAQRIALAEDFVQIPAWHDDVVRGVNTRVHDYFASSTEIIPFQLVTPFNNVWVEEK
ncbi:ABC transporter substrate-binding protein [Candidatus Bipolaricaulota bacterium]|nr:ABC transporter substrate-binding protein [Candidatus Bipolaricaulota bacterium]